MKLYIVRDENNRPLDVFSSLDRAEFMAVEEYSYGNAQAHTEKIELGDELAGKICEVYENNFNIKSSKKVAKQVQKVIISAWVKGIKQTIGKKWAEELPEFPDVRDFLDDDEASGEER